VSCLLSGSVEHEKLDSKTISNIEIRLIDLIIAIPLRISKNNVSKNI